MPRGHVFSHTTAARLWGLPLPDEIPLPLHVSAPAPNRQPRMKGVVGHRLGTGIRVARTRGLPVVAAADAWCQLATVLSHDDLVAAGDRIIGWPKPLAGLDAIDAAIERFGSRRGAIRLRAARADLRPGSASRRETRLRLRVLRAGFPEPELNTPITLDADRTTHGDLVFREYLVLLEYDGEQHRADDAQFHRDVERLNDLATAGWIVVRVGRRLPLPARPRPARTRAASPGLARHSDSVTSSCRFRRHEAPRTRRNRQLDGGGPACGNSLIGDLLLGTLLA